MSEPTGKCKLCGEPMPPGEEMFKFHGYSGDCPKPPGPRPDPAQVLLEEIFNMIISKMPIISYDKEIL